MMPLFFGLAAFPETVHISTQTLMCIVHRPYMMITLFQQRSQTWEIVFKEVLMAHVTFC